MKPPPHRRPRMGDFGFHLLNNTTPTSLTPQTSPHAVCWLCPLLGYFSYISYGQGHVESDLSMPNPLCLRGFPAAEPDSQTVPMSNPTTTNWSPHFVLPDLTFRSSQLSPKLKYQLQATPPQHTSTTEKKWREFRD